MIPHLLFLSFRKAKFLNYNAEALCIMHNYTASNLCSMMNHLKRVCGYIADMVFLHFLNVMLCQ